MENFKKTQQKKASFVDNCPLKWSDKETEKLSVGVGFKNTGYSTIKNNKNVCCFFLKKKTWSRCLHMKHACVFKRCPARPPQTLMRRRTFFFVRKKKQKATWLFLHCSVVPATDNWPLGALCPCEDFQKVLFSPPPTPPSPY